MRLKIERPDWRGWLWIILFFLLWLLSVLPCVQSFVKLVAEETEYHARDQISSRYYGVERRIDSCERNGERDLWRARLACST